MAKQQFATYERLADFAPDWVVLPGQIIADRLELLGWTQRDLAVRTGYTFKHINLLINGKVSITEETAIKLEMVLGSSAQFWLNLESQCREHIARIEASKQLSQDVDWLSELPVADMKKFGWVKSIADKIQMVQECLTYFGVASVSAWREKYETPVAAYRASNALTKNPAAVSAWLRCGERVAQQMDIADYDKQAFEDALQKVRNLTQESNPQVFLPRLQDVCAKSGVSVVLAPAPKGCPVSGAAQWLGTRKALIMLSLRGKSDDALWFTFFHEAGHLLKHGKKMTFMDILGEDGLDHAEETEANQFAADFLIPPKNLRAFADAGEFNEQSINRFARQLGIAPGIVLGRLQFDQCVPWKKFNHLKVRYQWAHETK